MKSTKLVSEFNKAFNFPTRQIEEIEPLESRQLRIKLLFEELEELAQAGDVSKTFYELCNELTDKIDDIIYSSGEEHYIIKDGNNVDKLEELDAIIDIQYLLEGKKLSSGLHEVCDEAFELVHGNNMDKMHKSIEHAYKTVKQLDLANFRIETNYFECNKRQEIGYLLFNSNGKLTKPFDHKKVDLTQLFKK